MSIVKIENQEVEFFKESELETADIGSRKNLLIETYKLGHFISNQLNIPCPDLGLSSQIRLPDSATGLISVQGAVMYTPEVVPSLTNNLIILSLEDFQHIQFSGTLAHEMRHIWQYKYKPELTKNLAIGFAESLNHPAEIDADGYAIWYISNSPGMYIDKSASILCPEEKNHYPKEYMYRIERAKEIEREMTQPTAENELHSSSLKRSIFYSIKNFLTKR